MTHRSLENIAVHAGWLLLAILVSATAAQAQYRDPPAAPPSSLNEFVLGWARGEYVTPIVCRLDQNVTRALRRVKIEPGPRDIRPPVATIRFVDLEADEATRCFTEIGIDAPNILGSLDVRHRVTRTRATAMRDFKAELKRNKGFDLEIVSGQLEIAEIAEGPDPSEEVDFRRGEARLQLVRPGSDASRLLADFPTPRKLELILTAKNGRRLWLPLAWVEKPGPH